ncbi:hypothetical protein RJE46_25050 (plasmid) [Cedecea neteri]|uniref:hypothetical protein n=1 Tax=Cedecea neteri TaxID=158822 RepID=UPI002892A103|nr:hypothetical protein [Cedecea neteri]WNJ82208.1 hypothetical protein RJE46_25050 [Cedecea neteri]
MMNKHIYLSGLLLGLLAVVTGTRAVPIQGLDFTATVTSTATCTITATPASPLLLPETNAVALMESNTALSGISALSWTFTDCPKLGAPAGPTFGVKGTLNDEIASPERVWMSKSSGTSRQFSVVLLNKENAAFIPEDTYKLDGSVTAMPFPGLGSGEPIPDNYALHFWVAMTCGGCDAASAQAGSLSSTLTFTFAYK